MISWNKIVTMIFNFVRLKIVNQCRIPYLKNKMNLMIKMTQLERGKEKAQLR